MQLRGWFALIALPVAVLIGGCATGSGHAEAPPAPMTAEEKELAIKSFDQVWETIRDRHFDPTYNGTDWNAVREKYRPQVEAATTRDEARNAMNGAIAELRQSHFGVISSEEYGKISANEDGERGPEGSGVTGIHARSDGKSAWVFRVDAGSSADKAGIKPGWRIDQIGKQPVAPLLAEVDKAYAGQLKRDGMAGVMLNSRLAGRLGGQKELRLHDGKRTRAVTLALEPPIGATVTALALPDYYLTKDARTLPSGVGYIAFSVYMDPKLVTWFGERVQEFGGSNAPGLIVDLRGNPGGIGAMAMGMGNWLVDKPNLKLGTMSTRTMNLSFVLNPQVRPFKGPVAVLVDEMSMSTSEIMAGGLQDIGRARVFGASTPGMALPSVVVTLPNGDGFQYAQANYVSADGVALEAHGVTPDEAIPLDPAALRAGRDPVIEAAERWIMSQRAN
jgi:carboxyl-terminal processing protease